jgi:ketosteroid isomerase-like protein
MGQTIEQEILQQEEQLAEAKHALNLGAIDRLYADDLVLTGIMGEPTCSKRAVIDEIKRGITERENARTNGETLEMSAENQDMKVVGHGDTAIANYRFVVKVKGHTHDVCRYYRATNVWMKQDGRWQIVAAHMSFVLSRTQAAMISGEAR